jgi:hypothetical protein
MHMSKVLFITDTNPDIPPDVFLGLGFMAKVWVKVRVRAMVRARVRFKG